MAHQGVCEVWATEADICAPCSDYSLDPAALTDALQQASEILFEMSGRRYTGVCERTVRPTRLRAGCACHSSCSCNPVREFGLGYSPIIEITELLLDGETLASGTDFIVLDDRFIARVDQGYPGFACCPNLTKPTTEQGTLEVTFTSGIEPPMMAVKAAASLACQLYLACHPDEDGAGQCVLPRSVTSVVRQGVTYSTLEAAAVLQQGMTGIYEVDAWLLAEKQGRATRGPRVMSPETRRARRVTS